MIEWRLQLREARGSHTRHVKKLIALEFIFQVAAQLHRHELDPHDRVNRGPFGWAIAQYLELDRELRGWLLFQVRVHPVDISHQRVVRRRISVFDDCEGAHRGVIDSQRAHHLVRWQRTLPRHFGQRSRSYTALHLQLPEPHLRGSVALHEVRVMLRGGFNVYHALMRDVEGGRGRKEGVVDDSWACEHLRTVQQRGPEDRCQHGGERGADCGDDNQDARDAPRVAQAAPARPAALGARAEIDLLPRRNDALPDVLPKRPRPAPPGTHLAHLVHRTVPAAAATAGVEGRDPRRAHDAANERGSRRPVQLVIIPTAASLIDQAAAAAA